MRSTRNILDDLEKVSWRNYTITLRRLKQQLKQCCIRPVGKNQKKKKILRYQKSEMQ